MSTKTAISPNLINMIPHIAHESFAEKTWLALPHTTQNQPQCVNKHQRALWVGNVLPKPMALFNLIPLPVTTVSPPQTPWQPHLHISAYLPFPFKSLSDWLLSWQRLCLHKQSLPASSYTVNTENVPSISITLKPLYYRPLKIPSAMRVLMHSANWGLLPLQ